MRQLKASNADKAIISAEVKKLLDLKKKLGLETGTDQTNVASGKGKKKSKK